MSPSDPQDTAKRELRRVLLQARRRRPPEQRTVAAQALAGAAAQVRALAATTSGGSPRPVAGFWPLPDEPPLELLLAELARDGVPVLLPVLRQDADLDWTPWQPGDVLHDGERGTRQPGGPLLGPDALAGCATVLAPALAVDRAGRRLGRGGGSFDRALPRVSAAVPVLAVVWDEELVAGPLPTSAHDRSVSGSLTPGGGVVLAPTGPGAPRISGAVGRRCDA